MKSRSSGILMPISSLPSEYGIGDFGKEAYSFVDFLVRANQKKWQILPLGMTGYGDSPYQCFSAFAGNPYYIDLDELIEHSYLTKEDVLNTDLGNDRNYVDYGKLYKNKMTLLRKAYNNVDQSIMRPLTEFYNVNKIWLREFAIFMALKEHNDNKSWNTWDDAYKYSNSDSVVEFERNNQKEIYFWIFTQYFFLKQWLELKEYANKNNIKIIGDLPIYVAEDSSDAWANPKYFNLNKNLMPNTIAGCPPDSFSDKGQLWGNPIYNWANIEESGYIWWVDRIRHSFKLYDSLRIDHFRGFDAYWEIKHGSENAINGKWIKGPGIKLFKSIKDNLGDLDIIAEDLGLNSEGLQELLKDTGFPNMKVLQFAFDNKGDSDYLPHNYNRNCVVYTGTHDNYPANAWFEFAPEDEVGFAMKYLKLDMVEGLNWGFIRGAWSSPSYLAIAQMQDFLGLGKESRTNQPSTLGNNWTWRINKPDLTAELAERIADLTLIYRR